jgi:hypothetical protein
LFTYHHMTWPDGTPIHFPVELYHFHDYIDEFIVWGMKRIVVDKGCFKKIDAMEAFVELSSFIEMKETQSSPQVIIFIFVLWFIHISSHVKNLLNKPRKCCHMTKFISQWGIWSIFNNFSIYSRDQILYHDPLDDPSNFCCGIFCHMLICDWKTLDCGIAKFAGHANSS